jgi:hypothetical protein
MRISAAVLSDPILHYRLDPGEPGLRQARARESALWVTAQERRNIRRLEAEARAERQQVIYENITYLFGRDGSFPSIRAGHTVVVSRPIPKDRSTALASYQKSSQQVEQPSSPEGSEDSPTPEQSQPPGEKTINELKREKERLLQREMRLREELREAEETRPRGMGPGRKPAKSGRLEQELAEVRRKLREVTEELQRRHTQEAQESISEALRQVARAAFQPLRMIFGAGQEDASVPPTPSIDPPRIDLLA